MESGIIIIPSVWVSLDGLTAVSEAFQLWQEYSSEKNADLKPEKEKKEPDVKIQRKMSAR